mgnify:CR=1 FL=1
MRKTRNVSIPLWFDYNGLYYKRPIVYWWIVSIPLWFDYNIEFPLNIKRVNGSQFHYGSITTTERKFNYSRRLFQESQFHYGSITTIIGIVVILQQIILSLNSTMVRLQQYLMKNVYRLANIESQFHYGSITTLSSPIYLKKEAMVVSIPLWFDYNEKSGEFAIDNFVRSQFHYGSITTKRKGNGLVMKFPVSIPLWFDYNWLTFST